MPRETTSLLSSTLRQSNRNGTVGSRWTDTRRHMPPSRTTHTQAQTQERPHTRTHARCKNGRGYIACLECGLPRFRPLMASFRVQCSRAREQVGEHAFSNDVKAEGQDDWQRSAGRHQSNENKKQRARAARFESHIQNSRCMREARYTIGPHKGAGGERKDAANGCERLSNDHRELMTTSTKTAIRRGRQA